MRKTKQIFYSLSFLSITLLFLTVFSEHLYLLDKVDRLVSWENLYLKKQTAHPFLELQGHAQRASQQEIASNRPECFKDRYSVDQIQREIDEVLSETHQNELYNGAQQEWRGISLSGLLVGHVNYFFRADSVLSKSIDVSQCRTAPCVFNTIYKKPEDATEGYVAFLFFLKTSYVLSGIRYNPDEDVDISSLSDLSSFYFKDREFYWLWLWLQSTSENIFHLKTLQNIYRFPQNVTSIEINGMKVCGRASFSGWIWLANSCLISYRAYNAEKEWWHEGNRSKKARSEAVESLTHEMAHHYDFSHRDEKYNRLSYQIDFLEFSNWSLIEYVNDDGLAEREWQPASGQQEGKGFISDYASTDPSEDFAESLAAFRYYPETLKEAAPEKFNYFKENVFEGVSYDWEGINELINLQILSLIQSEKRQWLSACLSEQLSGNENYENSFTPIAFEEELQQKFLYRGFSKQIFDCFVSSMDRVVESLIAKFKFEVPEGCYIFSHRKKDWWHEMIREEVFSLMEDSEDEEQTEQIASQAQDFRNQFKRSFNGEEVAIDCYQEESSDKLFSPRQCFESRRDFYIAQIVLDYPMLSDEILSAELGRLTSIYTYSKLHQTAKNRVKRVMQISFSDITKKAEEFVDRCSAPPYYINDQSPLYSPYRGIDTVTFRPWFLNCLNKNYRETLVELLERGKGGYITLDREFQRFIYGIYNDDFLFALDASVRNFIHQEDIAKLNALKQEILSNLKRDSEWYLKRQADESHLDACLRHSRQLVDSSAYDMVFNPAQTLSIGICSQLQEEEPYKSLFSQGLVDLYGDRFVEYKNIVLNQWNLVQQKCESSFSCLAGKIAPVLHRSWRILNEGLPMQYTRSEKRRMMRRIFPLLYGMLLVKN